ncbi:MAG: N-acetyltransferase [Pseudomonadota bacterium]
MLRLLRETPDDTYEVEMLFDLAFAPGRGALSSYQLRDGIAPVADLCTVARDDFDVVVAAIRYWPVQIGDAGTPALLLGPIAVHPTRQGEGLGALLIGQTLDAAADSGWSLVILVGDRPYYARFGFESAARRGIDFPPPVNLDRVLIRELSHDAMEGVTGMVLPWSKP